MRGKLMLLPTNMVRCEICKAEFHEDEFDYDDDMEVNVCPRCGVVSCFTDLYEEVERSY